MSGENLKQIGQTSLKERALQHPFTPGRIQTSNKAQGKKDMYQGVSSYSCG